MNQKKQRTLAIFALAIALVATTIAYATLSTQLGITGSISKKGGKWDVKISDVTTLVKNNGEFTKTPSASGTSISFNANLNYEDDVVGVKFRIHNNGTIDAGLPDGKLVLNVNGSKVLTSSSEMGYQVLTDGVLCGLYTSDDDEAALKGWNMIDGRYMEELSVAQGAYSGYYYLRCKYVTQDTTNSTISVSLNLEYEQIS